MEEQKKNVEDYIKGGKVVVSFKASGNAPQMKQKKFKLSVTHDFRKIITFVRSQLKFEPNDSLFLFINATFQPSPDETVLDLFKCFHSEGKLQINYSSTPTWG
eukprot:TRINITY_DN6079_c0_g1_i1.p1 TRINITY_DN6079_c0_g1~~TRINITY_DN6079_c0_g1_i1.p1  ORF type:complete len:103 (+),score=23.72 TRINITY_DN6079_c0_g1_i1:27-335(+)